MFRNILEDLLDKKEETIERIRTLMLDDFDSFYDLVILEEVEDYEPDDLPGKFEALMVLILDDRQEQLKFCWKLLQRARNKERNLLEDYPRVVRQLTAEFKYLYEDTKRMIGAKAFPIQNIEDRKLVDNEKVQELTFGDIFISDNVGSELKEIFSVHKYVDKEGKWKGVTGRKNELAIAYYVLKEPGYGFELIKLGDRKPQLVAFYREFGLRVSEKSNSLSYTSIRNLTTEPSRGDSHEEYQRLFSPLLKLKA